MGQLRGSEVRAGLRVLHALGERLDDPLELARRGVRLLPGLVASELTTLSICDLRSGQRRVIGNPVHAIAADERAAFDRHFSEHPLVRYHAFYGGRVTRRISDSIPFGRFRHTALYDEYYRRIGIDHAVALPVHVDRRWLVSFVLNRTGRDFSDRDRALLDLLRDGVAALYAGAHAAALARTALAALQESAESAGVAVARVRADGLLLQASARALHLMQRYGGRPARPGATLPPPFAALLDEATSADVWCRTLSGPAGALTVRAVALPDADGAVCLLMQPAHGSAEASLEQFGLSPRERDVVRWLMAGKADRDIAELLGISVRTVHKHLQRIYEKLGVENRTAAVMRVLNGR
jgi:DNA-binding CsgD family transcriptional regulator